MFSATTKEAAKVTKDMATNDIKSAAQSARRDVQGATDGLVTELSTYANDAGRSVRHMIDNASDTIGNASDKVRSEINTNPLRSSFVALGIGFILGSLFRR